MYMLKVQLMGEYENYVTFWSSNIIKIPD